jgi:DNA-binding Lrp family transcriptional regulator
LLIQHIIAFFDERILTVLKDGKPRGFTALLDEVGFTHNTLQQHLQRLTARDLVVKEKTASNNFGRPKLARVAVPKLVLNGFYSSIDFTRVPVFHSKRTLKWSFKMLKTELKPFLTILGTRMRAKKQFWIIPR